MNAHSLFADAAWLRLAIVGVEVLSVIAVVRLWAAVEAWWRARLRPVPATVRRRRVGPRGS